MSGEWLPPIHQPGSSRALHDDWGIKDKNGKLKSVWWLPWSYIPRTWTTTWAIIPPKKIWGNHTTYIRARDGAIYDVVEGKNILIKYKNSLNEDCFNYPVDKYILERCIRSEMVGPSPISNLGMWQFSIVYAGKMRFPLPYFCYRWKSGRVLWIGLGRWTNPVIGDSPCYSYVELFAVGFRMIKP